jgi:hypothetical protein
MFAQYGFAYVSASRPSPLAAARPRTPSDAIGGSASPAVPGIRGRVIKTFFSNSTALDLGERRVRGRARLYPDVSVQ